MMPENRGEGKGLSWPPRLNVQSLVAIILAISLLFSIVLFIDSVASQDYSQSLSQGGGYSAEPIL